MLPPTRARSSKGASTRKTSKAKNCGPAEKIGKHAAFHGKEVSFVNGRIFINDQRLASRLRAFFNNEVQGTHAAVIMLQSPKAARVEQTDPDVTVDVRC